MKVVHVLHEGRAQCGKEGPPSIWPDGHVWVRREDIRLATCPECIQNLGLTIAEWRKLTKKPKDGGTR